MITTRYLLALLLAVTSDSVGGPTEGQRGWDVG